MWTDHPVWFTGGSKWGLVFSVICSKFLVFAVKLANFLMVTVSEEKRWEGCSDIFGNGRTSSLFFGNVRQSSGIVSGLRKSSEVIRNCGKMAKNSLIY